MKKVAYVKPEHKENWKKLDKIAKRKNRSLSHEINKAVELYVYLDENKETGEPDQPEKEKNSSPTEDQELTKEQRRIKKYTPKD